MEIDVKEYQALDCLRCDKIRLPVMQIMDVLRKYFSKGTKVIIDEDCWRIEKEDIK